jgi:hypothetical protein
LLVVALALQVEEVEVLVFQEEEEEELAFQEEEESSRKMVAKCLLGEDKLALALMLLSA